MFVRRFLWCLLLVALGAATGRAQIFGTVRGVVHDPQHRPIGDASITLKAQGSSWTRQAKTNADGEFSIPAVPAGTYTIAIEHAGFHALSEPLDVAINSAPILHFQLQLESVTASVQVTAPLEAEHAAASSVPVTVQAQQIQRTPGADRTNSLAFITDFVPGAYMVHDLLHIRGGHQVSWLVDGVPVPNTNIASNVGPQFDPKDIGNVEISRGGYSAEYGDRTYGVINVVPRSGFEFNKEGDLTASFGSLNQTNDLLNFGGHTDRFAYYAGVNGNRTDMGLATPAPEILHDLGSGLGGFTSLIYNATPSNQLRLVASLRNDQYQIPNTLDQQAAGIADLDRERDSFVNFSWVHTDGPGMVLTVSPLYHYNRAAYDGGPNDTPIATDHRTSQYVGAQTTIAIARGRHNFHAGLYGFYQHDDELFGLVANDGSGAAFTQDQPFAGGVMAAFVEDQFMATNWLTLNGGLRLTHFSGGAEENAADPRIGASIQVPRLRWVLRGFYGRYYQPPPLTTVSGPLLEFAATQGFAFLPLRGERDEQVEFGMTIPIRGWFLDLDHFHTRASNFFDHDVLGNSSIFLPLTIANARIRGWEATVRSPQVWHCARFHLAYSHQIAEGRGGVTGGLTDFESPENEYFYLDHDQRDTLSFVTETTLPMRSWASATVSYGSGFLNGDGPDHLPPHATLDFSLGKSFGERWALTLSAINITNNRYLLDNSNTFGGTHWDAPRQFIGRLRYRFRF